INTSQPHPDIHQFVAEPGYNGATNRRLYVTTDGGTYFTGDIATASTGGGWSRKEQNYRVSQFYGADGDGGTGRITGGTQDNGHLTLQNGAANASLTFGGDGGFAAIDWLNANYLYGEYVDAQVHRSTDAGASANYIYSGIADAGSNANFIAPLILDPNDPTRLLVGGRSLWRTSNARAATVAWTAIKPAVTPAVNISAIAIAPGNANVVWVAHNDGRIFKTGNGLAAAPTWTVVDDNGTTNPLPNRYCNRILIDRTNSSVVYVAFGGFAGDNLWQTSDGGTSFVVRTGGGVTALPWAPINGICQHPALAGHLYVGTEVGVFASADDGLHWSTGNEGPGDVSVEEIVFLHNSTRLLIASHGRGLWTIDVREPVVAAAGTGCPGSNGVPVLTATAPRIGQTMVATCSSLPPSTLAILLVGFSNTMSGTTPLPLDLGLYGMPGCLLRTSPDLSIGGPAAGTFTAGIALPPNPATAGVSLFLQTFVVDPGVNALGATVSNALQCTIGQ
ncbi:MAG TPA: hypothetical protein VK348_14195, partial [Planctomycetota bacterium]|nr:hypothetical protein [Planctomycetota bacterium]